MRFGGKKAIVTGGASGIGRSEALLFAREGADIAIMDINSGGAEKVAEEVRTMGRKGLAIKADVSIYTQVKEVMAKIREEFGRVDILVNNAGGYDPPVYFHEMDREYWSSTLSVHVDGAFNCTRCVIESMIHQRSGRIINTSSVVGLTGAATYVHYSAAKAAIIGFTKALAREVALFGITVNAIAPGIINTPRLRDYSGEAIEKILEEYRLGTLVGRLGEPEDIAALCAFLASDEASFITGQVISSNGGFYM